MKSAVKFNLALALFSAVLISGCAALGKTGKSQYAGKWSFTVETPDGTVRGFLTIHKEGKTYTGTVSTEDMTLDLMDLKIENGVLTSKLDADGYPLEIKGSFKDDVFSGDLISSDFTIPFSANKVIE